MPSCKDDPFPVKLPSPPDEALEGPRWKDSSSRRASLIFPSLSAKQYKHLLLLSVQILLLLPCAQCLHSWGSLRAGTSEQLCCCFWSGAWSSGTPSPDRGQGMRTWRTLGAVDGLGLGEDVGERESQFLSPAGKSWLKVPVF